MEIPGIITFLAAFGANALIFAIFALGLNVQWGYTGLFNIGVAGFFAIGAYTSALVYLPLPDEVRASYVEQAFGLNMPFFVGIVAAAIVSGVIAYLIGLPTLRLREDYLAIATIGIAESIRLLFLNERWLANGAQGLASLRPFAGAIPTQYYNITYFAIVLAILLLLYFIVERAIRSPWGRVLRAVREDEVATEALGKDTFAFKMQAFVLGSVIMGIAGALFAHFQGSIQPTTFTPLFGTFIIWVMLILGGSGNNRGAILGAIIVWAIWQGTSFAIRNVVPTEYSAQAGYVRFMLIGLLLVLILIIRPQGILGEEKVVSRLADD